ncbi:MAG: RNA polymerase sigma factor [Rubrivivax sp.]
MSSPTTLPTDDDAALAAEACRGDAAAFERIMRRHNRLLFRTARGIVADDADAQDVVQETYLRAFQRLGGFRGGAALGTWLARIAINVALDVLRRRGRVVSLADDEADDMRPSTDPTPEVAAERAQMQRLLQAAIDSLPPIYRSVFILRAVQELSVDETADCLGLSADAVRQRHLRARALLRDALGARVEAHAQSVYDFAGARCDAVVAAVLAQLRGNGSLISDRPS